MRPDEQQNPSREGRKKPSQGRFARAGRRFQIIGEFWQYMRMRKKWWLGPILIVLLVLSLFIVLTSGSALAPFIYTLF